ncbi:unnamed protein product [Ilex paraguariensis]|uniref:Uncharacterized protein n=1 Tax=Ilex paraguariensis TaxID=185542 RepID=A0ABC8RTQ5_9AQUA
MKTKQRKICQVPVCHDPVSAFAYCGLFIHLFLCNNEVYSTSLVTWKLEKTNKLFFLDFPNSTLIKKKGGLPLLPSLPLFLPSCNFKIVRLKLAVMEILSFSRVWGRNSRNGENCFIFIDYLILFLQACVYNLLAYLPACVISCSNLQISCMIRGPQP